MSELNQAQSTPGTSEPTGLEIAIIGMSGRFPGAKNLDEFWGNLKNGVETNLFGTDEEMIEAGASPDLLKNPRYVKSKGAVLENTEYFDAAFFGYVPSEAELLHPQTRIFHECAWETLENAGYDPGTYEGSIGLYAGATNSFHWEAKALLAGKASGAALFGATNLMNKDFLSTRICYKLNLKGPGVILNTACSTSLVAIDLACRSILTGLCNMALAGGIAIAGMERNGYVYEEGMVSSPDGRCRAFDARAKGTFGGEGAGIVLLKILEDALEDGDNIHAVIKGIAVNNDGSRKVGYTAPSIEGQLAVIREAHQMAEIEPETVGYVETHGTGTTLGDPVEIEALKKGFDTEKRGFCALGALKTNIGHLDTAAGVAGLIKTVLALKHRLIPPTLHFESPNPAIDFENSPFYVNNRLREWNNNGSPLRAGVSSFGIGGTNAHIVLEEAPEPGEEHRPSREYQVLVLSAKTSTALEKITQNLAGYLKHNPGADLADTAYTLQLGRNNMNHRRMLVCKDGEEAVKLLESPDKGPVRTSQCNIEKPQVVFMFSGLGSQYENMALELYQKEELFRREVDRCFEILDSLADFDIRGHLYPALFPRAGECEASLFEIAQLEIFTVQYALAKLLISWGISPDAMIGYSFGEYSAACIAGVFSLEDLLTLIVKRGKLMRSIPAGAMMSVPLPVEELRSLLPDNLSLAIDNGPSCIVSGPDEAIADFENHMKQKRLMCMRLTASHAIHSYMMAEIATEFEEAVGSISLYSPQIPYISNVTADWIRYEDAVKPGYWSKHLQETVSFADGFGKLTAQPPTIFLEIGPGQDLTALAARHIEEAAHQGRHDHQALNLLRPGARKISDLYLLLNRLGQVWLHGKRPAWKSFYSQQSRRRIPLPTYPFEGQRFWIEDEAVAKFRGLAQQPGKQAELKQKTVPHMSDWFYLPHWTRAPGLQEETAKAGESKKWLVFSDYLGLGERLISKLEDAGHEVIRVAMGHRFQSGQAGSFTLRPGEPEDYEQLFQALKKEEHTIQRILHLWSLSDWSVAEEYLPGDVEAALDNGFYSVLYLVKAMAGLGGGQCQLSVVSDHLLEVSGDEFIDPGKAPLSGLMKVIPQEYPHIRCRLMDVTPPRPGDMPQETVSNRVLEEITGTAVSEPELAFRGSYRWKRTYEVLDLEEPGEEKLPLVKQGVYLITGGLGKIAMTLAEYFASTFSARLVLLDRVEDSGEKTRRLEELGAKVRVAVADIADEQAMESLVAGIEAQWGPVHGVIHAAGKTEGASFASLAETEKQTCLEQFQAKLYGTLALEKVFRNRDLNFCLLLSSVSTVLGGLRFGPYASANAFMDGFAAWMRQRNSTRWFSVDWDGMTPEDTVKGFKRVLALINTGAGRVVVSREGKLEDRLAKWVKLETLEADEDTAAKAAVAQYPRPQLLNSYIPPETQVQQRIVDVWKGIFGFKEIGIQDDFLELGGDSLKAITAISQINKSLDVEVPLADFFKRPTIEMLSQFIEGAETSEHIAIEPAEEREYYVLSSAQNRLYLLQQLDKQSTAYNETNLLQLQGQLDLDRLRDSLLKMMERHESLRTSIQMAGKEAVQVVHRPNELEFELEYGDLTENAATGQSETPDATPVIRHFIRPFDLAIAPFFRVGVIKLSADEFIMIIDLHHIVTDGVTFDLFVHELQSLYWGLSLPAPRLQYKDYSQWRGSRSQLAARARQEKYWLKRFSGVHDIPVLDLPGDYPRPRVLSFEGKRHSFSLSQEETDALRKLASDENATIFMVLLSIYYVLLHKLGGQRDIITGTPVVGRRHADLESIIGMFINTLPLRNFPDPGKTIMDFLGEVKTFTLEDFENQDYAFEDLVDRLAVKRDTSRNPLFDAMFVLQASKDRTIKPDQGEKAPLTIMPYAYETTTSKFDITLEAFDGSHALSFVVEYSARLFKPGTIQRFCGYYKKIAAAFTRAHSQKLAQTLADIDILSEEEKHLLTLEFNKNDVQIEYDNQLTIHGCFQEQARRAPGEPAVSMLNRTLTYAQLNSAANGLAQRLYSLGVRRGEIVALLTGRSIEMVVGMLAIMKTGAIYLPIDPGYPPDRVRYMISDGAAAVTVYPPRVEEVIDFSQWPGQTVVMEEDLAETDASPDLPAVTGQDPCYVIYTSGSTGKPKGALVRHNGFINLTAFHYHVFGQGQGCRVTQVSSPSFDAMAFEVWPGLLKGAALHIIPDDVRIDAGILMKWMMEHKITASFQSTAVAQQLIDLEWPGEGVALNTLWTAGDKLDRYPARNLPFRFYNLYGLTEATVWTTWTEVAPMEEGNDGKELPVFPTIGKPIANHQVYILGSQLELLPLGVPGELCIGGNGLALGYLNRPQLTAEKFVTSPLNLYRTGDLARWLKDGNIQFLGRIDNQVKIRGFRIELAEIEAQLVTHPQVKEAVVLVNPAANGSHQAICAYIVPENTGDPSLTLLELKRHLSGQLPDYMLPSRVTPLESVPLTPNGKIDKRTLLAMDATLDSGVEYVPPGNEIEKAIAGVWKEVLNLDKVGIHDNFFDVGGNSMALVKVSHKLKEILNREVPVVMLFQYTTISALAGLIDSGKAAAEGEIFDKEKDREKAAVIDRGKNRMKKFVKKSREPGNG